MIFQPGGSWDLTSVLMSVSLEDRWPRKCFFKGMFKSHCRTVAWTFFASWTGALSCSNIILRLNNSPLFVWPGSNCNIRWYCHRDPISTGSDCTIMKVWRYYFKMFGYSLARRSYSTAIAAITAKRTTIKKRSERRKHCSLAVVRQSQKISSCRRPPSQGCRMAKI